MRRIYNITKVLIVAILVYGCATTSQPTQGSSTSTVIIEPSASSALPSVAGVVYERVTRNNTTSLVPAFQAEIQVRNSTGLEISRSVSNARGIFNMASEMLIEGQEYILTIRTEDRRANLNFIFVRETARQFEITISDEITFALQDKRHEIIRISRDNPSQVRPFN